MTNRISGFDGLRALAVLMVFADHRLALVKPLHMGGFGVRLFFVLSGFLIIGILHRERLSIEARQRRVIEALSLFYRRRALRIFPIYYAVLGMAAVAACFVTIPNYTEAEVPFYWLFLTNVLIGWVRHDWVAPFSHLWSLAVEEQFYLLAAPILLLCPAAAMRKVCLAVVVLGFGWHCYLSVSARSAVELGMDPLSNFTLVAMGGVAALGVRDNISGNSARRQGPLLLACLLVPALGAWCFPNPVIRQLGFPLIVAWLLTSIRDGQSSVVVKLLSMPPLAELGRISYGFYLYHVFVTAELVDWLTGGLVRLPGQQGTFAQATCLFILSAGLAAGSWRCIERPMLGMGQAKLDHESRGHALVSAQRKPAGRQPPIPAIPDCGVTGRIAGSGKR
jgi:peptidoglycan/LPS O-acetylase OafA/YrhL